MAEILNFSEEQTELLINGIQTMFIECRNTGDSFNADLNVQCYNGKLKGELHI